MLGSLLNLFFPKICHSCSGLLSDHEVCVCTSCRHNLPITNFHISKDASVEKIFYGRVKIKQATALLRFHKKGIVQHLIHQLKYKRHEEIGEFLGKWLGAELKSCGDYKSVDVVIPVPMHPKKRRKRGYNQVTKFGKEIAEALETTFTEDVLIKKTNTQSQVNKKRFARWQSNQEIFKLNNGARIANKHILLVDDIITTGATIEACVLELNKAENITISIATMAFV